MYIYPNIVCFWATLETGQYSVCRSYQFYDIKRILRQLYIVILIYIFNAAKKKSKRHIEQYLSPARRYISRISVGRRNENTISQLSPITLICLNDTHVSVWCQPMNLDRILDTPMLFRMQCSSCFLYGFNINKILYKRWRGKTLFGMPPVQIHVIKWFTLDAAKIAIHVNFRNLPSNV